MTIIFLVQRRVGLTPQSRISYLCNGTGNKSVHRKPTTFNKQNENFLTIEL